MAQCPGTCHRYCRCSARARRVGTRGRGDKVQSGGYDYGLQGRAGGTAQRHQGRIGDSKLSGLAGTLFSSSTEQVNRPETSRQYPTFGSKSCPALDTFDIHVTFPRASLNPSQSCLAMSSVDLHSEALDFVVPPRCIALSMVLVYTPFLWNLDRAVCSSYLARTHTQSNPLNSPRLLVEMAFFVYFQRVLHLSLCITTTTSLTSMPATICRVPESLSPKEDNNTYPTLFVTKCN